MSLRGLERLGVAFRAGTKNLRGYRFRGFSRQDLPGKRVADDPDRVSKTLLLISIGVIACSLIVGLLAWSS
jgi:hypothetical protein